MSAQSLTYVTCSAHTAVCSVTGSTKNDLVDLVVTQKSSKFYYNQI